MSKQQEILKLLSQGKTIRRFDGRCGNGFVDKQALEALIRNGVVTVFQVAEFDFVKEKKVTK